MDLADDLTLAGTDVSSVSVIIVYHLFAIQAWSTRADLLLDEAVRLSFTTAPGDIRREDVLRRCNELRARFPWRQVILLGAAVAVMAVAGIGAGVFVKDERVALTMAALPLGTLVIVYLASTVIAWRQGDATIDEANSYLSA